MSFARIVASALVVVTALTFSPASFVPAALAQSAPQAAPVGDGVQAGSLDAPSAAPAGAVDASALSSTGIGDMSMASLFWRADPVVKAVFILLIAASLWSWTIIISKWLMLRKLHGKGDGFEKTFWSGLSLDDLYQQFSQRADHPLASVFISALREWRRAFEGGPPRESLLPSIKDRIDKAMNVTILREMDGMERQLGFLATVGSVSPFIGLFGTVWGIMNSFAAIAARHDTTLAVVAPGIAEALFATAMGLLAAIPAVIFYNRFVNEMARYNNRLTGFSDEFSAILSRQLDEKATR
ncbi:MAG TPA: protein TolQ [Rhizomicrobium sp.]|nr:protein TolQ [Rhizomicrobium sp.]